ncbi:hypothetical protein Pmani_006181 [Petrolisthes manimaculis]|uniref:Uncharacterized protein n=1 Tax=Petrolisthes manimaculis TaxID=1843537 RepID=A0AAE1UJU3_9EUCA|nr:hypothetical protein Pmani_006181 [Petrolisthes manimaculis]
MVNSVGGVCGRCGRAGCCGCVGGEGGGSVMMMGGVGPSTRQHEQHNTPQYSRQREAEWTSVAAPASPLLNTRHSCTNNSHPDILTELRLKVGLPVSITGATAVDSDISGVVESGCGCGCSSSVCGAREWRRHSTADPAEGCLARHVWSHRRIARSLSREAFFPTPNEHHPALLRPLAALGDLSTAYPDLPTRLQHLTDLLTHRAPKQPEDGTVLTPEDTALLTTVARLHLRQGQGQGQIPTLRRPYPGSVQSAPTTPESIVSSSRWPSLLSLTADPTSSTSTSEWPSRTSSLVSVASSLPDDDRSNTNSNTTNTTTSSSNSSSVGEEEVIEERRMAGGDLVAQLPIMTTMPTISTTVG